jgi:8-amino-7-oxononanoate synthase
VTIDTTRNDPRWGDLDRLRRSTGMYDAVIEEIRGRRIRIGTQWLADFASCNYLGFDLEEEVIDSIGPQVSRWGTHPSWSRLLGNPQLYVDIEARLTELLSAPDTLVLPTISLIHTSVIPALVGQGWVFVDTRAHKTIWDGCTFAHGQGATVRRVRVEDLDGLADQLRQAPLGVQRLVCIDGVNSMTGNVADLPSILRVCQEHDATLYVDDAHGFGVIGESPTAEVPYGRQGNSVVRYHGLPYEDLILVGGFSKAYSSLLAFLALPTELKNHLKVAAPPYLYSGPSPTASLATVLAGFEVNAARGEAIRADLYRKTARVLDHVHSLGLYTPNTSGLPIIELPIGQAEDIDAVAKYLFHRGIYVTIAAYPLVPRHEVGFRVQVTAANSDEEIDELNAALTELAGLFPMRHAADLYTTAL